MQPAMLRWLGEMQRSFFFLGCLILVFSVVDMLTAVLYVVFGL